MPLTERRCNIAGHIPPEFKSKLKSEGKWKAFCARRVALATEYPDTPVAERNDILLKEFDGADVKLNVPIQKLKTQNSEPKAIAERQRMDTSHVKFTSTETGKQPEWPDIIKWIFDNMCTDAEDITEAPSPGTLEWMRRLQRNGDMSETFYGSTVMKLLPNKAQSESGERMSDDGSDVLDLIDRVTKAKQVEEKK